MISAIRNFQNLLCSLYVQSDDERNVKHSVVLTKNVKETVKKKGRLGCCLIDSGQTGKSIYTAICLVQYWLPLTVNATALKLTVSKVRDTIYTVL